MFFRKAKEAKKIKEIIIMQRILNKIDIRYIGICDILDYIIYQIYWITFILLNRLLLIHNTHFSLKYSFSLSNIIEIK